MDDRMARLLTRAAPWIDDHLVAHGLRRTGPFDEPRVRSWSTVVSFPTNAGKVWFKAPSRVTAHEIPLYPLLVDAAPDIVLHPLGTDIDRSWILLPDGGASLMRTLSGDDLVDRLREVMPRYAELQRALMAHVPAMVAMGVPDLRPPVLPERFEQVLGAAQKLARDRGNRDDIAILQRVESCRPAFDALCEQLAASQVLSSLDHSDLHTNNMLLPQGPTGASRIYDWGDSVIGHPFSTLLVALRSLMDQLQTTSGDRRLLHVRDAYLEPFTDLAGRAELLELVDAACWTSVVTRALNWIRVAELGPPSEADWAEAPIAWMKTFLNDSWLD